MGDGVGGIVCLQDVRLAEGGLVDPERHWWRGRGGVEDEDAVDPVKWAHAPSPCVEMVEGQQLGLKKMGGTVVLAWGDAARGARVMGGGGVDKFGRWAALLVGGDKDGGGVVVVSAYRPPGGREGGGGLKARMAKLRGWNESTWNRLKNRARTAFYDELGALVRGWRASGREVIVCGDFNEAGGRGSHVWEWGVTHDMENVYEKLRELGRTGGEDSTYQMGGRCSRIDHVLVSERLVGAWLGGSGRLETQCPAGDENDHRVLRIVGADWAGWRLAGKGSAVLRRQIRAAKIARERDRPPRRIEGGDAGDYEGRIHKLMEWGEAEQALGVLERLSEWGGDLWVCRGEVVGEGRRVGWEGELVSADDWAEHEWYWGEAWEELRPKSGAEQEGTWWGYWGEEGVEVLSGAEKRVSEVEGEIGSTLVRGAVELSPQVRGGVGGGSKGNKRRPVRSRRRRNGWFPGIGQFRRAIVILNRMLACCRAKNSVRMTQLRRRAGGNTHLRKWCRQDSCIAEWSDVQWRLRAQRVGRLRKILSRQMQGSARSERRAAINEAIARRERAFREGRYRAVLDSVLKRRRGGAQMRVVEDTEGVIHTDPKAATAAATQYFHTVFSGGGNTPWFEGEGVGEGVRLFFEDSARGRVAREEGLRGRFHPDWDELPEKWGNFRSMVRFKGKGGEEGLEDRERAFGDLLCEISEQEWEEEWGRKSRYTSGGKSGVRPDMVKSGGERMWKVMRRLYSVCLRLGVIPNQWREAILVAIEKEVGIFRVDKLRPLKLLEVTMKGVVSILKNRVRTVVERLGLLHGQQMAFRAMRYTALCTMGIVGAAEDAMRYRRDIHVLTVDIRKAYDSVLRTIGKEAALRRIGVPLAVVEFLMELDRGNKNTVRTFWDQFLEGSVAAFEAERGFAQGSADAPLLWIIFYDMVLCELERRGVGGDIRVDIITCTLKTNSSTKLK